MCSVTVDLKVWQEVLLIFPFGKISSHVFGVIVIKYEVIDRILKRSSHVKF